MKIGNTGPVSSAPPRRSQKSGGDGSAFASRIGGEASVSAPKPAAVVQGVGTLLSVQEVSDPLEETRRAIERGEDLLDQLEGLRLGLLIGRFPKDSLQKILSMVQARSAGSIDPALAEILQEIELRAAVELAKLGQSA